MAKKSDQCDTPECDGTPIACGLCSACYSWAYYHKAQGVAETQAYLKRQRRVAARIERLMPTRKQAKRDSNGVHRPVRPVRGRESRAYLN